MCTAIEAQPFPASRLLALTIMPDSCPASVASDTLETGEQAERSQTVRHGKADSPNARSIPRLRFATLGKDRNTICFHIRIRLHSMPSDANPYTPPNSQSSLEPQLTEADLSKLKTNATNIFATGLFGILAPVVAIYSVVFLLRNRTAFPRRRLAVAGAILHCLWTLVWIYWFLTSAQQRN